MAHRQPKLSPKHNVHQHQHRQSVQWTAISRPDQQLERSAPQHYTATYRSQYYRTMTWTDFSYPTSNTSLEGCRVSWYRQLQNANHSILSPIRRTKTVFHVGFSHHTLQWDRKPQLSTVKDINSLQCMKAPLR